jgi:hypothetical protein
MSHQPQELQLDPRIVKVPRSLWYTPPGAAKLWGRSEVTGHAIVSTRYIAAGRERAYHLVFASPRPPQDDWLAIAETFEFLPEG